MIWALILELKDRPHCTRFLVSFIDVTRPNYPLYIYTICIYILANSNNSITAIHCSFWKSPQATQNHGWSKHYCAASDPVCFLLSRNPQWPQREVTRVHHCAVTISCNQHWVTAARTRWTCLDCLEPSGQIESNAMTISHISHISSRDSIGVPGP